MLALGGGVVSAQTDVSKLSFEEKPPALKLSLADAIQAALEGRASSLDLELEINGRRIRHFSPDELIKWHSHFKADVAREQRADRLSRGLGSRAKILVRL